MTTQTQVRSTEEALSVVDTLKLALEALEEAHYKIEHKQDAKKREQAIVAIKEVLAQPEQAPVGQLLEDAFGRGQVMWFNKPKDESMLYTTPPQRTWVGLTDEERVEMWKNYNPLHGMSEFMRQIEAKLKAKNERKEKNT